MAFEQKTWYNDGVVPDDAPEGTVAPCLDADNLNRIEGGIAENKNIIDVLKSIVDKMFANYVKACDFTNEIHSINNNETWIATQDCWVSVYFHGDICDVTLSVDGVEILTVDMETGASYLTNSFLIPPCFFVKKDSVISFTRDSNVGSYSYCKIYGCYK